jgi:hypothetical protein
MAHPPRVDDDALDLEFCPQAVIPDLNLNKHAREKLSIPGMEIKGGYVRTTSYINGELFTDTGTHAPV